MKLFLLVIILLSGCISQKKIDDCERQCMRDNEYGDEEECQDICYVMEGQWSD